MPALLCSTPAAAQIIDFESGGLRYQTLTKSGVTVMVAQLPTTIREFSIVQVAISNGSTVLTPVRPENMIFRRTDGTTIPAKPPRDVVREFLEKGGRTDVIRLVTTYEQGLYGLPRFRSTNGYEARRRASFAEVESTRLKSAATASAIVFVATPLAPGKSTDGAVFFDTDGKPLGTGTFEVRVLGDIFEFPLQPRILEQ